LSPEESEYYDNYFDLFMHPGWKQFVEDSQEILDSQRIEDLKTEKDLFYVQGQRSVLLNTVRFEDGIKNAFEELTNA
tara:strand:+ start:2442 stop:2672 length:231 start_codon:yes stop_codon:yes gene_type:complete